VEGKANRGTRMQSTHDAPSYIADDQGLFTGKATRADLERAVVASH